MSEISTDDLQEGIAKRDSDGELIADTHEIDWFGSTKVIKTKPITTGLLNELSDVDEAIADLDPEAVYEAFQTIYLSESILALSVDDIRDMKSTGLNALLKPLEEQVETDFDGDEGNPKDMSKAERAKQMR
jgi:hypothetical protein